MKLVCKADSGKTGDGGKPRDRADAERVLGTRMDESTLNLALEA